MLFVRLGLRRAHVPEPPTPTDPDTPPAPREPPLGPGREIPPAPPDRPAEPPIREPPAREHPDILGQSFAGSMARA